MPSETPIACSLDADEMSDRLAEMSAVGAVALLDSRLAGRRAQLRFADTGDIPDRLAAIVAAESACCAFLTMKLRDLTDAISLTIDAPDGAEPVLADLVAAFRGQPVAAA